MSKRLDILIDSNALSHLSMVEMGRKKAHTWLWEYFNVYTCTAVKTEFLQGVEKRGANAKAIGRKLKGDKKLVPRTRKLNRLEKDWLVDNYYKKTLSKDDKGERHLICTAIELVKKRFFSQVVLVTDDYTATKNFLSSIKNDVAFGEIWTTLDLITFMYYVFDEISYSFAENAIIDISSFESYAWRKYKKPGYREEEARFQMRKEYIHRLKQIRLLRTILV